MPPKPQVFKAPDGKEFTSRTEWRDYMMSTFYSFKNKVNEPEPLIKNPGDIDGQMFDIADCENSTLVIMDNCEQVQIDQCKNCRIFVGACASSIFIRDCTNCVFYTCCRQLRLRDVTHSKFYIYSMSEVHIEYSNTIFFAPFNGGYPDHARHLQNANLDVKQNLWYDIFDHNDPMKTHVNWALLPEAEYEEPWFPAGVCEPAVALTKAGSVQVPTTSDSNMQSFSFQQLMADAQALASEASKTAPVPPIPPLIPESDAAPIASVPVATQMEDTVASTENSDVEAVKQVLGWKLGEAVEGVFSTNFTCVLANGSVVSAVEYPVVIAPQTLAAVAFSSFSSQQTMFWADVTLKSIVGDSIARTTVIAEKNDSNEWKIVRIQYSNPITL